MCFDDTNFCCRASTTFTNYGCYYYGYGSKGTGPKLALSTTTPKGISAGTTKNNKLIDSLNKNWDTYYGAHHRGNFGYYYYGNSAKSKYGTFVFWSFMDGKLGNFNSKTKTYWMSGDKISLWTLDSNRTNYQNTTFVLGGINSAHNHAIPTICLGLALSMLFT